MTPAELKDALSKRIPRSHFFDRKTMRYFGDKMRNYGVREVTINQGSGGALKVYELYRKKPVKFGLMWSAYFDCSTLNRVWPINSREIKSTKGF